jgi:hypothetical protein
MAERSRASKTLLGCGLGCGGAAVLLVGGCVALSSWLRRPGEVLEPRAMLDPRATAYVACRLDLAEEPTRDFVERMLGAARRSGDQLRRATSSPLLDFFVRWNESRQRRDLARLFPITAAWVVWPGERDTESVGALLVSARGMSHQVVFMDWVLGIAAEGLGKLPARRVAGERVYEIPIERDRSIHAFLDSRGVVVCLDAASVGPAVERLRQGRAMPRAPGGSTDLERWLATVPEDLPLRGAVLGAGEVAQLLGWLAPGADRDDWRDAWEPIAAATVAGRFSDGGGIALTLELAVDPEAGDPRRELLLADLQRYFDEHWGAGKAAAQVSGQGVTLELLADELPRHLEQLEPQRRSGSS